jgi:hypothetical protein
MSLKTEKLQVSKTDIARVLTIWEANSRAGRCADESQYRYMTVEQLAASNAEWFWKALGGGQ